MRTIFRIAAPCALALASLSSGRAAADPIPFRSFQYWFEGEGGGDVAEKTKLTGYVRYLGDLDEGAHEVSTSVGLTRRFSEQLHMTLRLGAEQRWTARGYEAAFVLSTAEKMDFFDGILTLRAETDHEIGSDGYRNIGRYNLNAWFFGMPGIDDVYAIFRNARTILEQGEKAARSILNPGVIGAGLQIENDGLDFLFGPHLSFSRLRGPWRIELQHLIGVQDANRGQTMRLAFIYEF